MFGNYAIGVCRIEPENNIHVILEAFADASLPLMMVGNWENSTYGRKLLERYRDNTHIFMYPSIYDHAQLDVLRWGSKLYVHGHSCGGTNPSLVEAMYLGLPIAAFDVDFNRETTENRALYFKDADGLRNLLNSLDDAKLQEVGEAMKEIADRRYTWQRITGLYVDLF